MATTKRGSKVKAAAAKVGAAIKKPAARPARTQVSVSRGKATLTLSAADTARAEQCLRETGKISLGLREVRVTSLRDLADNEIIVN